MWMQWNHKFAYGGEEEKHWYDLGRVNSPEEAETYAQEACEEFANEYNWSDKYRGIDYTLHEKPPQEIIKKLIAEAKGKSAYWLNRAAELSALLDK